MRIRGETSSPPPPLLLPMLNRARVQRTISRSILTSVTVEILSLLPVRISAIKWRHSGDEKNPSHICVLLCCEFIHSTVHRRVVFWILKGRKTFGDESQDDLSVCVHFTTKKRHTSVAVDGSISSLLPGYLNISNCCCCCCCCCRECGMNLPCVSSLRNLQLLATAFKCSLMTSGKPSPVQHTCDSVRNGF